MNAIDIGALLVAAAIVYIVAALFYYFCKFSRNGIDS
jgi:hypothetical protein